ncbi:Gaa1-domain-containing protein [Neolentinus lepideus HHB14362 ss-1]|uniref:Gaa1-domain-containing protein n=1 Tax=Neolentinus lepideus HHB14362 ss-1 TaxID=1314782 RepID=A0A165UN60_9AGAM|nr:Gaa1-domain-containing protein [Neolentinus lepideus HHB14362 ss-1]
MSLLSRLKRAGNEDGARVRIRRRKALAALLWKRLRFIRVTLLLVGLIWMLAIPLPMLSQGTYIDENALQPAQVNTYWDWADVHRADRYLDQVEEWVQHNISSIERADMLVTEFQKLGIPAATQLYAYTNGDKVVQGANVYAVFSSPRASGDEAMVISASWLSRAGEGDGTLNRRGVSTVLALAAFLKNYSLWAKDIIFVLSDGYMEGMHAWLSTYHGSVQSNLRADPLVLSSGVIWTALNIDYPGHSFSHIGLFLEGLNGRLPNQDLVNSCQIISRYTGGIPVLLYDQFHHSEFPNKDVLDLPFWLPEFVKRNKEFKEFSYRAKNVLRHVGYQGRGMASGVHGLFHQFRIDAITLYGEPAPGPHGFHAMGRVVESSLRTTNNLLERLHASFFFYIMTSPYTFLKIGKYLPSAVLISVSMLFGGISEWIGAGWRVKKAEGGNGKSNTATSEVKWARQPRPLLHALCIVLYTHAFGFVVFLALTGTPVLNPVIMLFLFTLCLTSPIPVLCSLTSFARRDELPAINRVLKSINLCIASTVISVTSVLNFSLAATTAVLLGIPLTLASSSPLLPVRTVMYLLYVFLAFGWMVWLPGEMQRALWSWEILGVWFAPFVCLVYAPLALQGGLACLLPM